ncbi:recombination-associated protein RdgC [Halomonas sp. AOP43-A1-21]
MLAKNIIPFVLHTDLPSVETITEALEKNRVTAPLGAAAARSCQWCAALGDDLLVKLVLDNKTYLLMTMLRRERLLPPSVISEEVAEQVEEIEAREGRKVTRKEKMALKEQITEALLPRAFVRSNRFFAWIDTAAQRIYVNSASRARAEDLLDLLRESLGSLKVTPLGAQTLPVRAMTLWASDAASIPEGLALGDSIALTSKGDDGTVTARRVDIESDDIQASLQSGRQAVSMAIKIKGELSATLTSDLCLKSIKVADERIESSYQEADEDEHCVFMADYLLSVIAVSAAYNLLISALGGEAIQSSAIEGKHTVKSTEKAAEDHLYEDAVSLVRDTRKASVSALQRHFKIAFTRASEIMLLMERRGIVSAVQENGKRNVLPLCA